LRDYSLQRDVLHGEIVFRMGLMAHRAQAERIDERVVNEAFLLFKDLVALLLRTRGPKSSGQFILHQKLSLDLPSGVGPDPFEGTTRAAKRIERQNYRYCLLVK